MIKKSPIKVQSTPKSPILGGLGVDGGHPRPPQADRQRNFLWTLFWISLFVLRI